MFYEEEITIDNNDIIINFSWIPGESCRPNKFDPGSPEEYEIHEAWIEKTFKLYLDVRSKSNQEIIIKALQEKRRFYNAA